MREKPHARFDEGRQASACSLLERFRPRFGRARRRDWCRLISTRTDFLRRSTVDGAFRLRRASRSQGTDKKGVGSSPTVAPVCSVYRRSVMEQSGDDSHRQVQAARQLLQREKAEVPIEGLSRAVFGINQDSRATLTECSNRAPAGRAAPSGRRARQRSFQRPDGLAVAGNDQAPHCRRNTVRGHGSSLQHGFLFDRNASFQARTA